MQDEATRSIDGATTSHLLHVLLPRGKAPEKVHLLLVHRQIETAGPRLWRYTSDKPCLEALERRKRLAPSIHLDVQVVGQAEALQVEKVESDSGSLVINEARIHAFGEILSR
ncbi:hypothetical protein [Paraburkholderia unamae]|uniref:hypothetical protein n=1 Tax=Paraburkholderia unamae TaxID=219649 RepID=UPI0014021FA1|nr:hypothetical protein [Paraburkholderia unamae]